ncbi:MAG: hypothetical protein R2860_03660 [Desulfobacterales bacterium]
MTDQYNNKANWMAHYTGTAEEIIRQTDGQISAFVATIGTTGTLMGWPGSLGNITRISGLSGWSPIWDIKFGA